MTKEQVQKLRDDDLWALDALWERRLSSAIKLTSDRHLSDVLATSTMIEDEVLRRINGRADAVPIQDALRVLVNWFEQRAKRCAELNFPADVVRYRGYQRLVERLAEAAT